MTYRVEFNQDFYAVLETETDKLVINGNLWDRAHDEIEHDFKGDRDAWVLAHHADTIKEYEESGLTVWDKYNLAHGHKIN